MARLWTSTPRAPKSLAGFIASQDETTREAFLDALSPNAMAALPYLFEVWGRADHQLPPRGDWTAWLILGGRGSGKTRAGAEWVRMQVEGATPLAAGRAQRIALVAANLDQGREVMVLGESGILACSPADRRPTYQRGARKLVWPNGAEAQIFSAANPESLRGPQFDRAWSDELAKWSRARATWDMLQFGLRLSDHPHQVVTTTPRDLDLLREILAAPGTVTTSAASADNRAFLADDFLETITKHYEGTHLGRQELLGEMTGEAPDALFTRARIEAARVRAAPELDRIVIGVDPPATGGPDSDECGLVVAGMAGEAVYVLADLSFGRAAPAAWAAKVIEAWRRWGADRIVAEVNQGGDMVTTLLRDLDPAAPVAPARARRSKTARAEPVSLLYERGLVRHVGCLPTLEDQLCGFGGGGRSPDRVDALVWAVTELTKSARARPRARRL